MKQFIPLIALALLVGCGEKTDSTSSASPSSTSSVGNPVTAPVDYLAAQAKGKKSAEKNIVLTSLNSAIQSFQVQEGRYPKDLDELVKLGYLKALPDAPYNMKIVYDDKKGEVQVVSK